MEKKYEARDGAPFKKECAQQYGERLEYLASKNKGKVTPVMIVSDAENTLSPFHNYFEWNDKKASEQHRLQQARNLVNHIVEVVIIEGKPSKHKSFFSVRNGKGKIAYVTLKTAVTKQSYRTQVLNQLISTLENATEVMKLFRSYEK